ncbi:uncharacterized protein GGS22DRAFT_31894 [Annulohypoxylon maeteangense]|uniref:uncharacterized protein n=1 Tax=Annulohypoxylon maeteangense TaxID=1927788 RepID=UPI00200742C3|nr:uncharacterized protein GGS22DRAFT_31894 [Annulohypoxylon maeteangense]KAI0883517.1 hypothetical protein GGS22DRAFT_31894 [Annulohypoxylon maeteangense]
MPPIRLPSVSSPLSSPDSFATATESPLKDLNGVVTDISSPIVETEEAANKIFSKASQLPPELKQHCQIYLEENLYLITLNLLNSLLSSNRGGPNDPNYCPPPSQLSLLNTAIVHPKFTTRPREEGWSEVSVESLVYLRSILSRFGPINSGFKEAFRFINTSRHGTPDSYYSDDPGYGDDEGGDGSYAQLKREYHQDGIWRRGQDFFRVVGWAFNCSVLYPNRWRHWKHWLEFMLDILEEDLIQRKNLDEESDQTDCPMLRDSILATYIAQRSGRGAGGGLKWITEAIFADGSVAASARFQEIWQKEHKENPKSIVKKRKREMVNIDKGNFGGYMDDESVSSSQTSEPPTPQKRRTNSGLGDPDFQALEPAYVQSIPLRQRLFSLLSYLCHYLPQSSLDLSDLYQGFENTVKSLPLPIFTAFVNHRTCALELVSQISTLQGIAIILMPSSALKPEKVDRTWRESDRITVEILERCFLPYPANTIAVEDNAKLSVLLENLLQIVWCDGSEQFSKSLRAAVEKGIAARETKVKKKKTSARGRMNAEDPEAEAHIVLEMSGKRLLALVDLIEGEEDDDAELTETDPMVEDEDEDEIEVTFMTAMEVEDEEEDEKKYCTCRRKESGTMIACDNDACPYEWFHWKCVGLKSKPRGKWLCPECSGSSRGKRK